MNVEELPGGERLLINVVPCKPLDLVSRAGEKQQKRMSNARLGDGSTAAVLHLHTFFPHPKAEHMQSAAGTMTCSNRQHKHQQQQRYTRTTQFPISMSCHHIFLLSAVLLVGTATAQYFETKVYADAACQELESTSIVAGVHGKNAFPEEGGLYALHSAGDSC